MQCVTSIVTQISFIVTQSNGVCVRAVCVFDVSIEHELQCFCSRHYVFTMVFIIAS